MSYTSRKAEITHHNHVSQSCQIWKILSEREILGLLCGGMRLRIICYSREKFPKTRWCCLLLLFPEDTSSFQICHHCTVPKHTASRPVRHQWSWSLMSLWESKNAQEGGGEALEPHGKQVDTGRRGKAPCIKSEVHKTCEVVGRVTIFCILTPNIFGTLAWNLFHVVLLFRKNLRWFQHFWKNSLILALN